MTGNNDNLGDDSRVEIARLWMQAQSTVASFLSAAIHCDSDVDDLLQEVAVKIAREFDRYEPTRPFVNWAVGIARYELLAHLRRQGRDAMVLDPGTVNNLADACVKTHDQVGDMHIALESCVQKLDRRGRRAIQIRYYREGSLKDVAKELELSDSATAALLYRIRSALAKCIEQELVAPEATS